MSRFVALCAVALSFGIAIRAVSAATIQVQHLGQNGWYSDDTRNSSGTDLVGLNDTAVGKPGQTPTAADDTAIEQQIQFVDGPVGSTTNDGAVSIDGTSGNSGKSNISTINTLAGFGPGSDLVGPTSPFTATYQWQDQPNPTSRTLAFKLGIQSTQWGTGAGESQNGFTAIHSGEPAWDLVLVGLPATSDNAWSTVTFNHNTGFWNLFRQAGNSFFPAPNNADDVNGNPTKTLDDWAADPTFGPLLFGAGAKVTSIQFGLGSSQRQSIAYLDYLQTNLLNNGGVVDFATPEPGSLTLMGVFGVAAMIRRRRRAV